MPGQSARHHLAAPSERRRYPSWYFLEQKATHLGERREVGNFVTTDGLAELRRIQADQPGRFAQFEPDKKRGNLVLGGRRQR